MAETSQKGAKEPRRWWPPSDAVAASAITALPAIAVALITLWATASSQNSAERAALQQQRLTFSQQRALDDRHELRNVLDAAAGTLDTVMNDMDRIYERWRSHHVYPLAY